MGLHESDVLKVAQLARLRLSAEEVRCLTSELAEILAYFEQLDELDVSDVQPMAHAVEIHNVMVEDSPHQPLPRDAALANAPKRDDECFLVPPVLGD